MSSTDKEQILVCKGTSGMGNRILAACTAILYGEITGCRVFIDWQEGNYADTGTNAFPLFFNCPNPVLLESLPEDCLTTESITPSVWKGKLDISFGKMREDLPKDQRENISVDISKDNYHEDVLVFGHYTHQIYKLRDLFKEKFEPLVAMTDAEILRLILNRDFPLTPEVDQSVEDFKREKFGESTLGVHVRFTDMKIPVDKIIEKVQKVLGRNQDRTIFLATDAEEVIGQFKGIFPNVVTAEKWFPEAGGRLHLLDVPDKFENGVEAIRDIFLLKECDGLVFSSRSSFGRVASLLSSAPPEHIYDIEKKSLLERATGKVKSLFGKG